MLPEYAQAPYHGRAHRPRPHNKLWGLSNRGSTTSPQDDNARRASTRPMRLLHRRQDREKPWRNSLLSRAAALDQRQRRDADDARARAAGQLRATSTLHSTTKAFHIHPLNYALGPRRVSRKTAGARILRGHAGAVDRSGRRAQAHRHAERAGARHACRAGRQRTLGALDAAARRATLLPVTTYRDG